MTIERPSPELEKILFNNNYIFVMKSKKLPFDTFMFINQLTIMKKLLKNLIRPLLEKIGNIYLKIK